MIDYKSIPPDELMGWFNGVDFYPQPFHHQLVSAAFVLGEKLKRVMYFHGIGTGKTLTALFTLQLWNPKKTLIVVPDSIIPTWTAEIEKQGLFQYEVIKGIKKDRKKLLNRKTDIYIINYEGLKVISDHPGFAFRYDFNAVVFDECHRLKSMDAQQTDLAYQYSHAAQYAITMTGTLIGRNAVDLFAQYWVLNQGQTFGTKYYAWLNHYFFKSPFTGVYESKHRCQLCGKLYAFQNTHLRERHSIDRLQYIRQFPTPDISSDQILLEKISHCTIRYTREECGDLPPKVYQQRYISPSTEQLMAMSQLVSNFNITDSEEYRSRSIQKLLQICGGFLINEDGGVVRYASNPKLAELANLLEELTGKIIIYHWYIEEHKILLELMNKLKIKAVAVNGTTPNKAQSIQAFRSDPKTRVLIAHPKTGGEGINLQIAQTTIYYSNAFIGTILRDQTEGRTNRTGQDHQCLYIDLILKGTADEIVYESLMNKWDTIRKLMEYFSQLQHNSKNS